MAMVVNDVTKALQVASNKTVKKLNTTKSDITPFQKVLAEKKQVFEAPKQEEVTKTSYEEKTGEKSLQSIFKRASEKYDISYDFLIAVAKAESNFNPKCVSSAGAQGIMQVMPAEQKGLGIKDPFDAEQNIMGAAKLLKAHLDKFNGDYTLAAAAYNAGSGRVKKYGGVPPFEETQNYVKKISKFMKEGVTVPDKTVKVSESSKSSSTEETEDKKAFDKGTTATEADLEKVSVAVGTGDSVITMSYGAYLKYLEVGNTGVG